MRRASRSVWRVGGSTAWSR
uniref:Uncharacterized protein n=1 Tax=Arundo donax TaxID=35708 RepID=A0A0A9C059_ARUDO